MKVKGTKVMSATSFVTAMLEKKQSSTRIHASCRAFLTQLSSAWATHWKTPVLCSPDITPIRQNRMDRVRRSI